MNNLSIKIFYRITAKSFGQFLLNICGLSIGLLSVILILAYLYDDLTFDKHHKNHENIYRIGSTFYINNKEESYAISSASLAPILKEEIPGINSFTRFKESPEMIVMIGNERFTEKGILFADSTVFNVFSHRVISGNLDKSLSEKRSIVLTEGLAKKYFGDENPVGKTISIQSVDYFDKTTHVVKAVIENVPQNSHLKFDGLISFNSLNWDKRYPVNSDLWNVSVYSYILCNENFDASTFSNTFVPIYEKYMAKIGEQVNTTFNPILEPFNKVHFHSSLRFDNFPYGDRILTPTSGADAPKSKFLSLKSKFLSLTICFIWPI